MASTVSFEREALAHFGFLQKLALKITRNEDDAQDLVQETVLRAFKSFGTYQPGTNCRGWLCRILRNTFINHYRKQRKRANDVHFDDVEETLESQAPEWGLGQSDPENALVNSALNEDVHRVFAQLPPGYGKPLRLLLEEGLSYREIAGIMGCPVGTTMSRIHRARKLAQKQLMPHVEFRTIHAAHSASREVQRAR